MLPSKAMFFHFKSDRSRKSSQEIETKSVNLGNLLGNLLSEEYKSKVSSWKSVQLIRLL